MIKKFEARRSEYSGDVEIQAGAEAVFPLLCPVREHEWIADWDHRLVFSSSGLVEGDCVFTTDFPYDGPTVWVTIEHDPSRYLVEFLRFSPGIRLVRMKLVVTPLDDSNSRLTIRYLQTGLGAMGNREVDETIQDKGRSKQEQIDRLGQLLNHFLLTGRMLESKP